MWLDIALPRALLAGRGLTKPVIAARLLPVLLPSFASVDRFHSAGVHRRSNRILCRIKHLALACKLRCWRGSAGPSPSFRAKLILVVFSQVRVCAGGVSAYDLTAGRPVLEPEDLVQFLLVAGELG